MTPRKRKKPQPTPPPRRPRLSTLDPLVRKKALELAKGDTSRVEVVSPTEALVR